jgi:hypothetical protein
MRILRYTLSIFLLGLLALTALFAFQWRNYQDAPIFFYASLLVDKFGVIPYRDLFEINMPGTYLACLIIGRLTGYTVLGVRILDYISLAVIIALGFAEASSSAPINPCNRKKDQSGLVFLLGDIRWK